MSQYQFESAIDCQLVQFGFDHACGYFVTIYDAQDEPVSEEDSLLNGLTGVGLVERLCEHIDPAEPPELEVVSGHEGVELAFLLALAMGDMPF